MLLSGFDREVAMAELALAYEARSYSMGVPGRSICKVRNHHWVTENTGGDAVGAGELFCASVSACALNRLRPSHRKKPSRSTPWKSKLASIRILTRQPVTSRSMTRSGLSSNCGVSARKTPNSSLKPENKADLSMDQSAWRLETPK